MKMIVRPAILTLGALAAATAAWAGVYKGPGYYVTVSSSYVVSGTNATGYTSQRYYGAIEGPLATEQQCHARRETIEANWNASRRSLVDGYALFMCAYLEGPMMDDSGEWWNPRRDD